MGTVYCTLTTTEQAVVVTDGEGFTIETVVLGPFRVWHIAGISIMLATIVRMPPPYPGQDLNSGQMELYPAPTSLPYPTQQPLVQQPAGQYGAQQPNRSNVIVPLPQVGGVENDHKPPVDYSTQARIACLCCFFPTGLIAIAESSKSRDAVARGDLPAAHAAAKKAKTMVHMSYLVGLNLVGFLFLGVLIIVYFVVIKPIILGAGGNPAT